MKDLCSQSVNRWEFRVENYINLRCECLSGSDLYFFTLQRPEGESNCNCFALNIFSLLITFSKCPYIYIKLTGFEDIDSGKLPFKSYLLRCCSF